MEDNNSVEAEAESGTDSISGSDFVGNVEELYPMKVGL